MSFSCSHKEEISICRLWREKSDNVISLLLLLSISTARSCLKFLLRMLVRSLAGDLLSWQISQHKFSSHQLPKKTLSKICGLHACVGGGPSCDKKLSVEENFHFLLLLLSRMASKISTRYLFVSPLDYFFR